MSRDVRKICKGRAKAEIQDQSACRPSSNLWTQQRTTLPVVSLAPVSFFTLCPAVPLFVNTGNRKKQKKKNIRPGMITGMDDVLPVGARAREL